MKIEIENVITYCRVSTTKQAQSGDSIETQNQVCGEFAKINKYSVLRVFKDSYSGRKSERPAFNEMIKYIKMSPGKVDAVLVRDLDRFSRGGPAEYMELKKVLSELGVSLIDTTGTIKPAKNKLAHLGVEFDWSNQDDLGEILKATLAKEEVSTILTRMIGAEVILTRQGYKIGSAQDGYINHRITVDGKKRTIMKPDPERSHFFIKMFEMRASGRYSDKEIVAKINELGYRTKKRNRFSKKENRVVGTIGGVELTTKQLQQIIQNPIYCGVLIHKWLEVDAIKTKYSGLITIELFNKANHGKVYIKPNNDDTFKILYDQEPEKNIKRRLKRNSEFPFKNVVLCPKCNKRILGSKSKGKNARYGYYHCSRGHKYIGYSKQAFEEEISNFFKTLSFNNELIDRFEKSLIRVWRKKQADTLKEAEIVNERLSELNMQKSRLIDKLIEADNKLVIKELEQRVELLEKEIKAIKACRASVELKQDEIHEFIGYARCLMEHPAKLLLNTQNIPALESLFGIVFEKLPTYQEIVNRTPRLSFVLNKKGPFFEKNPSLQAQ